MPDYVSKFNLEGSDILVRDRELPHDIFATAEKGKNILFIGDGWTLGAGADDPDSERFSTVLCESLGMNEFNYAVSASGFARSNTFQDQAVAAISGMTAKERRNTNIIMIVGGINDLRFSYDETFAQVSAAISLLITTLLPSFPNAVICFAINTVPHDTTAEMMEWIERMKQYIITRNRGKVMLFDSFTQLFTGNISIFDGTLLHPTTTGHARIAGYLKNALLGGLYANPLRYVDDITWTRTGYSTTGGGHIYCDGKFVYIEQTGIAMTSESGNHLCGIVPEGVRPSRNVYFPIYKGTDGIIGTGLIVYSGNIYINQLTAADSADFSMIMYPCAK